MLAPYEIKLAAMMVASAAARMATALFGWLPVPRIRQRQA